MLTADWLARSPQRYPWIPNPGMARNTPAIRISSPKKLMKKVYAVFPSPFIVLSIAAFVYRNGQIQASVTIKRPAVSLWKRKRPIKDPNRRKKRQQARPRMKQLPAVFPDQADNIRTFSGCLLFCDCGHQHRSDGIGYGGRKKDARQSHSGEYAVENERLARTVRIDSETRRDRCGFNALQKGDSRAVCSKRK